MIGTERVEGRGGGVDEGSECVGEETQQASC